MKKLIALFLATLMVISLCTVFAVADDDLTLVSKDKTYTITGTGTGYINLTGQWPSKYDAALTDGVAEAELTFGTTNNWFGFYYNTKEESYLPYINAPDGIGAAVIDLGEVTDGLSKFRAHLGNHAANGVNNPDSVKVYTSVDGKTFTEAGTFEGIKDSTQADNAVLSYWAELSLTKAVSARYVKFEFDLGGTFTFVNEIEVYKSSKAADEPKPTIEMKDFFVTHFNDNTVEGAGSILTEAYTGAIWWIHVAFKPVEGKTGVYEVVEISDGIDNGNATALAIPEGGFVYAANTGNDYISLGSGDTDYTNPHVNASIALAKTMTVGSKWVFQGIDFEGKTIPTTTPDLKWYDDNYVCTAKIGAYVEGAVIPGDEPSDEPEEAPITVDGTLTDKGWASKGWTSVKPGEGGTWQGAPAEGNTNTVSFDYQIRKDDTKLYIAAVFNGTAKRVANDATNANGNGTNFRFWLHNGDEAAVTYTHFIDACLHEDGTTGFRFMMNTKTDEVAKHSPAAGTSKSLTAVVIEKDGKTYCEISIDLADLQIPEGKTASVIPCVSNNPTGNDGDNLCLFAGEIPYGDATADKDIGGVLKNFPYNKFYFDVAVEVNEDIVINVQPDVPATGDNGIIALVILAVVAMFGTAIVIKSRG